MAAAARDLRRGLRAAVYGVRAEVLGVTLGGTMVSYLLDVAVWGWMDAVDFRMC